MYRGRFEITDGTTTIDLLGKNNGAFCVQEWLPAYPGVKGDGIWLDNPLLDGRTLAIRKQTNIVENIVLTVRGQSQSDIYSAIRKMRQMLDKATKYWTDRNKFATPVYFIIQYPEESQATQAFIMDYRLPKSADPFAPPMFAGNPPVVQELLLTVERGYRVPIGSICADLDYSYTVESVINGTFLTAAIGDDCSVNNTAGTIDVTAVVSSIGNIGGVSYSSGFRFTNITIPNGATIKRARIIVYSSTPNYGFPPSIKVIGELDAAPAGFSTYANFVARPRTREMKLYNDTSCINAAWVGFGSSQTIPIPTCLDDLADVVQEIVDLPGWASGNNLTLFVEDNGSQSYLYKTFAEWDHPTYNAPRLYIEYVDKEQIIEVDDNSCGGVIISNEDKFNELGDILIDDGGVFTALNGTALPWTLFPAVPAVNDALYIACNMSSVDPGAEPFSHIIFDILTAIVNAVITWEIWTGAAWVSAGVLTSDKTNGFANVGENSVHIQQPSTWVANAVNGITAYWLRARISSSAGAITPPVQQGPNEIHLANRPYIDITKIPDSDFPNKLRVKVTPDGANASAWPGGAFTAYSIDEVYLASRTINRGADFTPYLNLSGYADALPDGIAFTGAGGANTAFAPSPVGYVYRYNPVAASVETDRITLAFISPAIGQYSGKFRIFLRRYGTTDPDHLSYRLKLSTVAGGTTPAYFQTGLIADTVDTSWRLVDFGVVDFTPPAGVYQALYLTIAVVASDACDVHWSEIIMLPIDEMFIHTYQRIGADVADYKLYCDDSTIVIDGVSGNTLSCYVEQNSQIVNPFLYESNSTFELDISSDDIRLWFLLGSYQGSASFKRMYYPITGAKITVEIQPKYI